MGGWLAGQRMSAQRLNDNAPTLVTYASIAANTAAATTTTLVAITTPNVTFRNNRAYRIMFKGLYQCSTTGDQMQVQVRKATITGAAYVDSFRLVPPAAGINGAFYLANICTNTSGADITTTLVGCYFRVAGGAGTASVLIAANAANPAYVEVTDIGLASDYPGATALT